MNKQKKTAEEAVKTGEFIALDKAILDRAGLATQVILPAADHRALKLEKAVANRIGGKVEKLACAVAFEVFKCQRSGVKADVVVQVLAKGFPALAMGIVPFNEKGEPVIVLSIAKKAKAGSCKTK